MDKKEIELRAELAKIRTAALAKEVYGGMPTQGDLPKLSDKAEAVGELLKGELFGSRTRQVAKLAEALLGEDLGRFLPSESGLRQLSVAERELFRDSVVVPRGSFNGLSDGAPYLSPFGADSDSELFQLRTANGSTVLDHYTCYTRFRPATEEEIQQFFSEMAGGKS